MRAHTIKQLHKPWNNNCQLFHVSFITTSYLHNYCNEVNLRDNLNLVILVLCTRINTCHKYIETEYIQPRLKILSKFFGRFVSCRYELDSSMKAHQLTFLAYEKGFIILIIRLSRLIAIYLSIPPTRHGKQFEYLVVKTQGRLFS